MQELIAAEQLQTLGKEVRKLLAKLDDESVLKEFQNDNTESHKNEGHEHKQTTS